MTHLDPAAIRFMTEPTAAHRTETIIRWKWLWYRVYPSSTTISRTSFSRAVKSGTVGQND